MEFLTAFIPVSQRIRTVLRYHCNFGQTCAKTFTCFFYKVWLPNILSDIMYILKHCKTCENTPALLTHLNPLFLVITVRLTDSGSLMLLV